MNNKTNDIRVCRQPIRDRGWAPAGFELLHRRGDESRAVVTDGARATDDVIRLVYGPGGIRIKALGGLPGFVNVDAEMLFSQRVESLPTGRVMLELLETVEVDEHVIARCIQLKNYGYGIALDDFCELRDDLLPLLDVADIVKVDVIQVSGARLDNLVAQLRQFPLHLLAEKVETSQCARHCRNLRFDFFQGYYFDPPGDRFRDCQDWGRDPADGLPGGDDDED